MTPIYTSTLTHTVLYIPRKIPFNFSFKLFSIHINFLFYFICIPFGPFFYMDRVCTSNIITSKESVKKLNKKGNRLWMRQSASNKINHLHEKFINFYF